MSYRPITDIWILGRPKVKYYGAYPNGFLERARALLGITPYDALLHVCGGAARQYPAKPRGFGPSDRTLDLDPQLQPDYLRAATEPLPPWHSGISGSELKAWPAIIADPPYTLDDAMHYQANQMTLEEQAEMAAAAIKRFQTHGDTEQLRRDLTLAPVKDFPSANKILRNMLDAVRPGGRVGMLHYVLPAPPSHEAKRNPAPYRTRFVACVGVIVGFNNRMRTFSVFEREG